MNVEILNEITSPPPLFFFFKSWILEWNLNPHDCAASALLTEVYLQSPELSFLYMYLYQ